MENCEREGEKENYSEVEKIELIDFSSEDDILVDYPFRDSLQDLRLSVTFNDIRDHNSSESLKTANQRKVEYARNTLHQREEMLSTPVFLEPRRASYLRKSIAWDNAFFSSDGVLDPEELSALSNGHKGQESSFFPGIPEDLKLRKSVDSDLTFETLESDAFSLESDAFSLESFDGNLFEDVRASIHRSYGSLNLTSASCDSVIGKSATPNVPTSKKFHAPTQNKGKSNATSRKQTTNNLKTKTVTESSLPSPNLQHKGEYNLMPSILGAQNTISRQTKRASLGYGNTRNRISGNGQGLMVPKQSASVDSPSSIKFVTPRTKSSSTVSLTTTKSSSVLGSSCDEFSSASSSKSILSSGRRNIGSSSSKIASSGSNSKPPLRYSGRSTSRLSNGTSSTQLPSMSRHSNNSPASSIDGWSSESSSSTCNGTAKRRFSILEDKLRKDTNQASGLHQLTHIIMSADQHVEGSLEASSVPKESPNNSKPSGLRMPSPKIGFFDEEKPVVRTTIDTVHFRFRSQNALSDLNANAVKKRPSKIQPLRCVPGTRNNIRSPLTPGLHCTSGTRPQRTMHSKQLDSASTKSTVMKNSLGPVLKLRTDTSFEVDNAYCSKVRKIGKGEDDRKKIVLTSSLKTEGKRNKGISKNKTGKEAKDQKSGNCILLETVNQVKKDHEAARELHTPCESKENFEDQVNGLSRYFEVIDLGGNAVELEGRNNNVHEHNESVDGANFPSGQQDDSPSITRIPLADKFFACQCHQSSPL